MNADLNKKYVYIINEDLKMSKGEIAAQVSHVAMQLGSRYGIIGRAIVLKAPEEILRKYLWTVQLNPVFYVEDVGLTDGISGCLTCIGFKETEDTIPFTENLNLV